MSNELIERLREKNEWTNQKPYFHAHTKSLEAADLIEAQAATIAQQQAELAEQKERLGKALKLQMDERHKSEAEAKLWFDKAQKWGAELAEAREVPGKIVAMIQFRGRSAKAWSSGTSVNDPDHFRFDGAGEECATIATAIEARDWSKP